MKGLLKKISLYHKEKIYFNNKRWSRLGRVFVLLQVIRVEPLQYLLPKEGFNIKFLFYYLLSVEFYLKYIICWNLILHIYYKDLNQNFFPK